MTNTTNLTELGHSPDAMAQRQAELLALLRQTAPEVVSDNQIKFDKLKELLGEERIAPSEHYELNWAGKTEARREIQKTSSHTLRPDANNPAQAQHMLIEGENLEVLRVLQKSYYGKVKMIYIDPPYNTGNDSFVYPDDYSETLDEYQKRTGEKSAEGYLNKQSLWKKNSKESGQYHSAWLSMMYPRLYLARNLLRDDGVIFISIDDNEAANLKLLCDEVFGTECFVCDAIWRSKDNSNNDAKTFSFDHNHTLIYSKSSSWEPAKLDDSSKRTHFKNPDGDPRGPYFDGNPLNSPNYRENLVYFLTSPNGVEIRPPKNGWRWSKEVMEEKIKSSEIRYSDDGQSIKRRTYLNEMVGLPPSSLWIDLEKTGHNRQAKYELLKIIPEDVFDTPKPVKLINYIIQLCGAVDGVYLDFFAGSGTTAHAVMELNAEDGGNRRCISVQMPEVLEETSEAYKAGYRTIADITRARIDKVISKLKAEHPDKTADLACAHFTLVPSNFKVWRGDVGSADALREQLALFQSAEKAGQAQATDAQTAMLAELLLKHGLGALGVHAVSAPKLVAGVTVHRVLLPDDKHMWLCFEPYTDALKDEMVKARPAQVVLLNSCFVGDKADEQLSNLQLELAGLDIGLTVI
ncbi:site-specific DNA-methyltransferase [Rhodoferax aquaticus]|uniref:site-specific DNA-methyltransferase (adenine-specific) n=1 Tax=Rhodoferax aquaticus TaxID=2527691 RepID=A0A515EJI3_9BURK|nr:site-specific DNA-methyltransferase [Rhodoferax aquaticus]QDL52790.1 site-specific DNA-methyltransferase [Rhodoferax aquaticus]